MFYLQFNMVVKNQNPSTTKRTVYIQIREFYTIFDPAPIQCYHISNYITMHSACNSPGTH